MQRSIDLLPRLAPNLLPPKQSVRDHRAAEMALLGKFGNALYGYYRTRPVINMEGVEFVHRKQELTCHIIAEALDLLFSARAADAGGAEKEMSNLM